MIPIFLAIAITALMSCGGVEVKRRFSIMIIESNSEASLSSVVHPRTHPVSSFCISCIFSSYFVSPGFRLDWSRNSSKLFF